MIGRVVFFLIWIGVTGAIAHAGWTQPGPAAWERGVALLFPLFGVFGLWHEWPRLRRRRSLRRERRAGAEVWVWLEVDGTEAWSAVDPTPAWDAADADGDGDGGD